MRIVILKLAGELAWQPLAGCDSARSVVKTLRFHETTILAPIMETNQLTSLSLLDRLQQPDNDRDWEMFLSIYRPFIRKHLLRSGIHQTDVDDVLQESLAEMLIALPKFQHNGNTGAFRKWIKTIVVRKSYRVLQQHAKTKYAHLQASEQIEQFDQSLEQMMEREHDQHIVNCLLKMIRPEFTETAWSAFELQVLGGKKAAEVAELLGGTTNSVLLAKSRVMRRLRKLGQGIVEC